MYIFGVGYKKIPMDVPALQHIHGGEKASYAFFMNAS